MKLVDDFCVFRSNPNLHLVQLIHYTSQSKYCHGVSSSNGAYIILWIRL